jgi:hypothetical protein
MDHNLYCVSLKIIIMRLITHNMLKCNIKGVESGYPLQIEVENIEEIPCEFVPGNY